MTNTNMFYLSVKGSNKSNPAVSEDLLAYYDNMTKAILGFDEKVVKVCYLIFISPSIKMI